MRNLLLCLVGLTIARSSDRMGQIAENPASISAVLGGKTWKEWRTSSPIIMVECPASSQIRGQAQAYGAVDSCTALTMTDFSRRPVLFLVGFGSQHTDETVVMFVSLKVFTNSTDAFEAAEGALSKLLGSPVKVSSASIQWIHCGRSVELGRLRVGGYSIRTVLDPAPPHDCR